MIERTRRSLAKVIGRARCRDLPPFARAARVASCLRLRSEGSENLDPPVQFWKAALSGEVLSTPEIDFAKCRIPHPVGDHKARQCSDFGLPPHEPAPNLRPGSARAISFVAGIKTHVLFRGPSRGSASAADTRIFGPGQWQWSEIECPIPIARRYRRWPRPSR